MFSKGFKIVSPKTFEIYYESVELKENHALVKINMGAVCKADLRYFLGKRDKRILGLKYPMRLIHEAVGEIIKDPTNTFKEGQKVVLVPNITECSYLNKQQCKYLKEKSICNIEGNIDKCEFRNSIGENYCPKAKFASSNTDGFSCEYMSFAVSNLVPVDETIEETQSVFAELTSVGMSAIRRCKDMNCNIDNKVIAVWGDGIVGYILTCILKVMAKDSKIITVGKNEDKLAQFPSDKTYEINEPSLKDLKVDLAFECVGGMGSKDAINQIIDVIKIGGRIVLTGVAEDNVAINTRKILEKGLVLTGTTRSSIDDFKRSVRLMEETDYNKYLGKLVNDIRVIENITDYYDVFEIEAENKSLGKTLMKFNF